MACYITLHRGRMLRNVIIRVLIGNGFNSNVCLAMALSMIHFDVSIRQNRMMVRAFSGSKTSTCNKVDLKILVGPYEVEVSFVVVVIRTVFNLLLGRRWINMARAIH